MSIYLQINKDMDPSQKRILEGQWTEICNQRAEMEDSKNAPMKNLLLNSIGYKESEGQNAQQVIGNQLVTVNTGLTPADAFREFDRVSKIIMNPAGEFATWGRVQGASRSVNIGKQVFDYRKVSADGEGAQITMSGQTGAKSNHTSVEYAGTIIPIIDKAFGRNWREIMAMRADGYDALVDDAREADLTIRRKANDLLWEGSSLVINDRKWGGLRGDSNVIQHDLSVDLVDPSTTADEVYAAFRTMRDILLINNNVSAGLKVAVSRELYSKLETPFSVYDKGFGNILQMVQSLSGIEEIYFDPKCSGNQLLFAHIGFEGLSAVTGMAMATVAVPRNLYNDDFLFIKAMAQGYIAKVDSDNHKSALYASKA